MPKLAGLAVGVVLAGLLVGCGRGGSPSTMAPPSSCIVLSGEEVRTITLGLTRTVEFSRAPVPTNPDEAMVFGMAYRTLLRMDCTGRIHPGLASSWESRDDGRRWILDLREDARFADGSDLTARDVAESWQRTAEAGASPWTTGAETGGTARPTSVEVVGSRRLELTFSEPRPDLPTVLTAPALAVVGPAGRRSRPPDAGYPVVQLRPDPGADPRDLLGAGVDVVVTDDSRTLEYARLRSDLVSRPLPWSRRYVLLFPSAAGTPTILLPSDSFLEELARDVVRTEARPAVGPGCVIVDSRTEASPIGGSTSGASPSGDAPSGASLDSGGAAPTRGPRTDPSRRPRIGYETNDPTARALAERLVALATAPDGSRGAHMGTVLAMLGLDVAPSRLVAAPESGALEAGEIARVSFVPRRPDTACREEDDRGASPTVIPLVETRQTLIVRRPTVSVAVDGSGTPYLFGGGS